MLYSGLLAVHVLSAVIWGGGGMLGGFFLFPSIQAAGPADGRVIAGMIERKFGVWMGLASIFAIGTGLILFVLRAVNAPGWLCTPQGLCLALGGLLGLGAFAMGFATLKPQSERVAAVVRASGGALSGQQQTEVAAAQARMFRVARIAAWHLLAATLLMVANGFLAAS